MSMVSHVDRFMSRRVRALSAVLLFWLASLVFVTSAFAQSSGTASLMVSPNAQRTGAKALPGSDLSGKVAIFAVAPKGSDVRFWLDDPSRQGPAMRIELSAPYDLMGTARSGLANLLDTATLEKGTHTVTIRVRVESGARSVLSSTFGVGGGAQTTASTTKPTTPAPTPTTKPPTVTVPTSPPQPALVPPPPPASTRWAPTPGQDWQIQLSGRLDMSVEVPIYDVDGFGTTAAQVAQLHNLGRKVICYIDVGGWENYRPDASAYPASVLGSAIGGWPDERWIDVRQWSVVGPLIAARFDLCKAKGFDAVDPDLLDAWQADSGFPLTYADQITFNSRVAALAHERGMSIALKGNVDQAGDLVSVFDFTINEQCVVWSECNRLSVFVSAGKAVLHIEYDRTPAQFCPITLPLGFSSIQKHLGLDAWRGRC